MVDTKEPKDIENQIKYITLDLWCYFFTGCPKALK